MNETTCQSVFLSLLRTMDGKWATFSLHVREILEAPDKCGMKSLARSYIEYMEASSGGCTQRIASFNETTKDKQIATEAVSHFKQKDKQFCLSHLTFVNKIRYYANFFS